MLGNFTQYVMIKMDYFKKSLFNLLFDYQIIETHSFTQYFCDLNNYFKKIYYFDIVWFVCG